MAKKITFIGDVHGKISSYKRLTSNIDGKTIQVGDMGLGFKGIVLDDLNSKDTWFDGNHDDVSVCKDAPGYMGRFGVTREEGIFYAGGAFSVDAFYRTPGVNWWHTEQMNHEEMMEALQLYSDTKPDIVATHDCPRSIYDLMLQKRYHGTKAPVYENHTANLLQQMLEIHKPNFWIFGHWHRHVNEDVGGVRFVCVDELQPFSLEF